MSKSASLIRWVWLGAIALLLIGGCTKKKSTSPTEESIEPVLTVMQQYFPLDYGDSWTWEVTCFRVAEEFVDGDSSLGEPFVDSNHNGVRDYGEFYEDVNSNGKYDGPNDPWESPIPYADRNGNGEYDSPNGKWDVGELFLDLNDDGVCDTASTLTLCASILYPYPQDGVMIRGGQFLGTYSNGQPGGMSGPTDNYSNDSLGLQWYGKGAGYDICQPLVIAQADPQVGDSIGSGYCWIEVTAWTSVFETVEDVTVPAGSFQDCYKFKFIASGWTGDMALYNGISYAWFAKDVGMVKLELPTDGEYWIVKSATVGGVHYP
jgi:hypothetical protein